jgi:hypothetical protein
MTPPDADEGVEKLGQSYIVFGSVKSYSHSVPCLINEAFKFYKVEQLYSWAFMPEKSILKFTQKPVCNIFICNNTILGIISVSSNLE